MLPFLVEHLSHYTLDGIALDVESPGAPLTPQLPLYGTLVSTTQTLINLRGGLGAYYLLPDVCVRRRGRYHLLITLTGLPMPAEYLPSYPHRMLKLIVAF